MKNLTAIIIVMILVAGTFVIADVSVRDKDISSSLTKEEKAILIANNLNNPSYEDFDVGNYKVRCLSFASEGKTCSGYEQNTTALDLWTVQRLKELSSSLKNAKPLTKTTEGIISTGV